MHSEKISLEIKNSIAHLSFFHPKANALDKEIIKDLTNIFNELKQNNEVKVVLFSSKNEKVFSSGLFLDDLETAKNKIETEEIFFRFAKLLLSMICCPKPIVGLFLGNAIGGAVGLLACCDWVMAKKNAQIRLSELSIGIAPLLIEPFVSKKIGFPCFLELSLHPKTYFEASWAKQKGLINKVIEEKNELINQVEESAKTFTSYSQKAFYELKKTSWQHIAFFERLLKERAKINASLWWEKKNEKNEKN